MLDEMQPLLSGKKSNDLLGRLSDEKRPEQLLGAEMELGLLWSISRTAHLHVDPEIPGSTRVPEAFSMDLFESPSYIEVTTVWDGKLSGEGRMRRASQKIMEYANTCRRKSGNSLYFAFAEKKFWEGGRFYREHHVAADFELDDGMRAQIRSWINAADCTTTRLSLQREKINVTIACTLHRQIAGFNFSSPLPALAYDIEDNPLYAALKAKADQLAGVPDTALKVCSLRTGDRGSCDVSPTGTIPATTSLASKSSTGSSGRPT